MPYTYIPKGFCGICGGHQIHLDCAETDTSYTVVSWNRECGIIDLKPFVENDTEFLQSVFWCYACGKLDPPDNLYDQGYRQRIRHWTGDPNRQVIIEEVIGWSDEKEK
jgi:hypothetical protein